MVCDVPFYTHVNDFVTYKYTNVCFMTLLLLLTFDTTLKPISPSLFLPCSYLFLTTHHAASNPYFLNLAHSFLPSSFLRPHPPTTYCSFETKLASNHLPRLFTPTIDPLVLPLPPKKTLQGGSDPEGCDDDTGSMSEAETSATEGVYAAGMRGRGTRLRSSLPIVRSPSKTLERPLG